MLRHLAIASTALALAACATVRHDTPEAQQQIKQDLGVSSVAGSSEMNWCIFKYGDDPACNAQRGAAALTPDGLVLMRVAEGRYTSVRKLTADEVVCSSVWRGRDASGYFYAFTDTEAFMLVPLAPGKPINTEFKGKVFDYLHSNGQRSFAGTDGKFIRKSGKKAYGATSVTVGGNSVAMGTSQELEEIYSPCFNSL